MCTLTFLYCWYWQVTSALAYLHSPTEVGIVHRDLKNGNILVFRFPEIGHLCFKDGLEGQKSCDVFVKLTDMGVCANPLAYSAKALGGLRQFVPESVTNKASWRLTEKVSFRQYIIVCWNKLHNPIFVGWYFFSWFLRIRVDDIKGAPP